MNLKEKITSHINDTELKLVIYSVIDKALQVKKNHIEKQTSFLNPYELKNAISAIEYFDDLSYMKAGGYEDAERNLLLIYNSYREHEDFDSQVAVFKVIGNFKFNNISHKDYLGALLGLGIKREKVGDIVVGENCAYIIVSKTISDYVYLNLNKIGNESIRLEPVEDVEIDDSDKYEEVRVHVSSARLDALISKVYNISRQESCKLIDCGYVRVNFEPVKSVSASLKEGSLVSVRSKGRFLFEKQCGTSRKDKLIMAVKKLV